MQCVVRLPWRHHKPGEIVSPGDGLANLLISRGILKSAEAIDRPSQQPEAIDRPSQPHPPEASAEKKPNRKGK